jgi:hypothetical protein
MTSTILPCGRHGDVFRDRKVAVPSCRPGRIVLTWVAAAMFALGCDGGRQAQTVAQTDADALAPTNTGDASAQDGATTTADTGTQDGATTTADGATAGVIWPANATKVVAVNQGGGFGAQGPAGAACRFQGEGSYTVTVADKQLVWKVCQAFVAPTYTYREGTRTLDDGEFDRVLAALGKVQLTTRTSCGADKASLSLRVTTPAGEKEYLDSFYLCAKQGIYVDEIDGVFSVLDMLAK